MSQTKTSNNKPWKNVCFHLFELPQHQVMVQRTQSKGKEIVRITTVDGTHELRNDKVFDNAEERDEYFRHFDQDAAIGFVVHEKAKKNSWGANFTYN